MDHEESISCRYARYAGIIINHKKIKCYEKTFICIISSYVGGLGFCSKRPSHMCFCLREPNRV